MRKAVRTPRQQGANARAWLGSIGTGALLLAPALLMAQAPARAPALEPMPIQLAQASWPWPRPQTRPQPSPRPRENEVPRPPALTPVPGLIVDIPTVPVSSLPRPWKHPNSAPGPYRSKGSACNAPSPSAAGFGAPFTTGAFAQLWAAQGKLIALEDEAQTQKLLNDILDASHGVALLKPAADTVGLLLKGYKPPPGPLQEFTDKAVSDYNASFYAPELFIALGTELAQRTDIKEALADYLQRLEQSEIELAKLLEGIAPGPNLLRKIDLLIDDYVAFKRICQPRLLVSQAVVPMPVRLHADSNLASDTRAPNYPLQAMGRLFELDKYGGSKEDRGGYGQPNAVGSTLAAVMMFFDNQPAVKPLPSAIYPVVQSHLIKEEQKIAERIAKASFDDVAQFEPSMRSGVLRFAGYAYGLAARLPKVAKAISDWKTASAGLMVDGADTRSYLERAKSNAPPSSADVRKLFTTLTMEATQRNTGLRMTRISDYSFSNPEGDGGAAGETTVQLWGLECAPEANKQRCRVSTLLAIKERRLLGVREYGLGLTTYNVLVSWGKDGLESADLRKQALGWMTPGTSYSSSSGNRPGETMEDRFVERDRENRLRFEDSQRFENGVWQQYDPIRRY